MRMDVSGTRSQNNEVATTSTNDQEVESEHLKSDGETTRKASGRRQTKTADLLIKSKSYGATTYKNAESNDIATSAPKEQSKSTPTLEGARDMPTETADLLTRAGSSSQGETAPIPEARNTEHEDLLTKDQTKSDDGTSSVLAETNCTIESTGLLVEQRQATEKNEENAQSSSLVNSEQLKADEPPVLNATKDCETKNFLTCEQGQADEKDNVIPPESSNTEASSLPTNEQPKSNEERTSMLDDITHVEERVLCSENRHDDMAEYGETAPSAASSLNSPRPHPSTEKSFFQRVRKLSVAIKKARMEQTGRRPMSMEIYATSSPWTFGNSNESLTTERFQRCSVEDDGEDEDMPEFDRSQRETHSRKYKNIHVRRFCAICDCLADSVWRCFDGDDYSDTGHFGKKIKGSRLVFNEFPTSDSDEDLSPSAKHGSYERKFI